MSDDALTSYKRTAIIGMLSCQFNGFILILKLPEFLYSYIGMHLFDSHYDSREFKVWHNMVCVCLCTSGNNSMCTGFPFIHFFYGSDLNISRCGHVVCEDSLVVY